MLLMADRVSYEAENCDAMAIALGRLTGFPLGLICGRSLIAGSQEHLTEPVHAVVVINREECIWLDVDGLHRGIDPAEFSFLNAADEVFLQRASEDEIKHTFTMTGVSEDDVRAAQSFASSSGKLSGIISALRAEKPPFPVIGFDHLWHVGTLDPSDKNARASSEDGRGLSISRNPDEWVKIASLDDLPCWQLTRPGNRFLDYHWLSKTQMREIADWCVRRGYAEKASAWEYAAFDFTTETYRTGYGETMEAALGEIGFHVEDGVVVDPNGDPATDKDVRDAVRQVVVFRSTRLLSIKIGDVSVQADPELVQHWMAIAYAEDGLGLDGVWWDDPIAPARMMAPKGVIFPSRLSEWEAEDCTSRPSFG